MKECVYYHWFGDHPKDIKVPLLASIATLRSVSDIPVVVLDISEKEHDWDKYPNEFNFEVMSFRPELKKYEWAAGWKHLSRIFDLEKKAKSDIVIYCDADVFWLKDPRPLAGNIKKFCFDGYNTGFFYYQHNSIKDFFEVFKAYTISALNSKDVRQVMKKHVGYDDWYYVFDEMIMTYIDQENKDFVCRIPLEEHGSPRRFSHTNMQNMKNLHLNGVMIYNDNQKHCRGLGALLIKEFYERLPKSLVEELFTPTQIEKSLKNQFSIVYEHEKLTKTRTADGHYHLNSPTNFIF